MLGETVAVTVEGLEFDDGALVALIAPTLVAEDPTEVVPPGNFTVMDTSPVVPAAMGLTIVNVAVPVPGSYAVLVVCASPTKVTSAAACDNCEGKTSVIVTPLHVVVRLEHEYFRK
jgi:hypothetical protein